MKEVIECKRIGVAVIGLEVPHAHIHLIPHKQGDRHALHKPEGVPFSRRGRETGQVDRRSFQAL